MSRNHASQKATDRLRALAPWVHVLDGRGQMLVQARIQDRTPKEIAAQTGINQATVSYILSMAAKRLEGARLAAQTGCEIEVDDLGPGMTHQEIANVLGVSPGRVQQLEQRAFRKLRRTAFGREWIRHFCRNRGLLSDPWSCYNSSHERETKPSPNGGSSPQRSTLP